VRLVRLFTPSPSSFSSGHHLEHVAEAERASLAAQSRRIETEAAPIRYVAELLGADTDAERAIRRLIALMVLCCDPLAIGGFGTAANSRLRPHLMFADA
jgi:hypothetical protein